MEGRVVRLVVVDASGEVLGSLPDFEVDLPYWQETEQVVSVASDRLGVTVDVLRLLDADRSAPHGGHVSYLAQVRREDPVSADLESVGPELERLVGADDPLRMPYARVGGPAAGIDWALAQVPAGTEATQQRTWNLSAIWHLDGDGRRWWVKAVPPFFGHEGVVLEWLASAVPDAGPVLVARDDQARLLLMADAPGRDLAGADITVRGRILRLVTRVHRASLADLERLAGSGVPDLRGPRLTSWLSRSLRPYVSAHGAADLLEGLDQRMADVAACGLPDVLVHGDLWPGNAVGDADHLALLDWGDSFLGHPGFDVLRLVEGLDRPERDLVLADWKAAWADRVPGGDPARALDLLTPLAPLRMAAVYAGFLAGIEATERPYHAADVPACLDRAVEVAGAR